MRTIRVALAQINTSVGDFDANTKKIIHYVNEAEEFQPDIIAFPELAVCGYPPEDLLLQLDFLTDCGRAVDEIARKTAKVNSIIIIGFPEMDDDAYNSAAVVHRGRVLNTYRKIFLPNYGVFDEKRYFASGDRIPVYETPRFRFGLGICEDIWHSEGPVSTQALLGDCELVININSSPYDREKRGIREQMISTRAQDNMVAIAYLNCVGGQDELVFDGYSFVVDAEGEIIARAKPFQEQLLIADINVDDIFRKRLQNPRRRDRKKYHILQTGKNPVDIVEIPYISPDSIPSLETTIADTLEPPAEIWTALVIGLSDYIAKNKFKSVVFGLSGGIDSSLVATLAADAIAPKNVYAVFMPTKFTMSQSYEDAKKVAENLGINFQTIEIDKLYEKHIELLNPYFDGKEFDTTEENIQSRIRGNILMALSNKFGHLVLATGNKSEMSVGYATLYGDMVGGFAVLKDVPKTMVWELAKWKNQSAGKILIPNRIIQRAPSAELREKQLDVDTLPPYEILDEILHRYIEEEMSIIEIVEETGYEIDLVREVANMVDRAEFKRRQSPPGIKITAKAFGKERRMPI
ncbi:NAD+ synthase, partial [bacterium]